MNSQTEITGQLQSLTEKLHQPEFRKSDKKVHEILADDFIEIRSNGVMVDKKQTLQGLSNQQPTNYHMSGFQCRILAPGLALTWYTMEKSTAGSDKSIPSIRSSLWKLISGRWQLSFHQGTRIDS